MSGDYTALYLAGALVAFAWVVNRALHWLECREAQREQERLWNEWIAAYEARHKRRAS